LDIEGFYPPDLATWSLPDAGMPSAIIISVAVFWRRSGIDRLKCLRDILTRLPPTITADDLDPSTPATGCLPHSL